MTRAGRAAAVSELLGVLAQARVDYQSLERNDAQLISRHNDLLERFNTLLEESAQIRIQVGRDTFVYEGEEVYKESNPRASLPGVLFNNGIQELRFRHGMPSWELAGFIDLINGELPDPLDDDLVTLFWERELPHIAITAVEEQTRENPVTTLTPAILNARELPGTAKYTNVRRLESRRAAVEPTAMLDAVRLSDEDFLALKKMDADDRERDLALDVLEVLVQTLTDSGAGETQVLELLSAAIKDHENPRVRAKALEMASAYPGDNVRELVVRGLRDESPEVRRMACQMSQRFQHPTIEITLASLLREDDFKSWPQDDQSVVAVAYGHAAGEAAMEILEEMFISGRPDTGQLAAARGLAAVGTPDAERFLRQAVDDNPELAELIESVLDEGASS